MKKFNSPAGLEIQHLILINACDSFCIGILVRFNNPMRQRASKLDKFNPAIVDASEATNPTLVAVGAATNLGLVAAKHKQRP